MCTASGREISRGQYYSNKFYTKKKNWAEENVNLQECSVSSLEPHINNLMDPDCPSYSGTNSDAGTNSDNDTDSKANTT